MMFPSCPGATATTLVDKLGFMTTMSNDCGSVDTDEFPQDEEVNCVFCGKLFSSIEKVQEHISQCHEAAEIVTENVEQQKGDIVVDFKPLKVFDLNTELILTKALDYSGVVQCSKCDRLFISAYASRVHFEKVHLGRKRKRSSNPNGVEGIIISPTGSDNWGCDICSRQFPTLKQAKVHKFKSHIEPVQKKEMVFDRNILQKNNDSQQNYVKRLIAENKFREILPNCDKSKIDKCQSEQSPHGNNDGESSCNSDQQGSLSASGGTVGAAAADLWRAAQAGSRGNKIVISRVYQSEVLLPDIARIKYGFLQRSGYSCFYCREVFINRERFKRHLMLHQQKKCYKCRNCGSKFKRIRMLKQHQSQNCEQQFTSLSESSELNAVTTPNMDVCKTSPKAAEPPAVLPAKPATKNPKMVPIQSKDEDISLRDIKFAEKFLDNPSITLNKGSQCVCNLCQSCFYSNNSILRHLVLYHRIAAHDGSTALAYTKPETTLQRSRVTAAGEAATNSKPSLHFIHNCDSCGSQFASKKGLQRHLHSVHMTALPAGSVTGAASDPSQQTLACVDCGLSFEDPQSLDSHRDDCAGWSSLPGSLSRRVKCDVCGRRFRNPSTLDEHRRLHGDMCALAGLAADGDPQKANVFFRAGGRQREGGGKRALGYEVPAYKKAKVPPNSDGLFECDVCHKTFTCRSSLSNHVKSHFNFKNKPFSCSACNQGFMSTLTLQYHRDQLCPSMGGGGTGGGGGGGHNGHSGGEPALTSFSAIAFPIASTIATAISTSDQAPPQTVVSLFSNFEGVSQVYQGNGSVGGGGGAGAATGGANMTTRATSCMHCSAMFPDRSLLEDHASKEHSNHAGEVVCIICPRSFTTYMAFRVHMTKSHGGPNGTSLKSHLNTAASSAHKTTNTSVELIQEPSSLRGGGLERPAASPPNGSVPPPSPSPSPFHLQPFQLLTRHYCPNCDKDFSTSQALGNHKRACMPHLYKKVSL